MRVDHTGETLQAAEDRIDLRTGDLTFHPAPVDGPSFADVGRQTDQPQSSGLSVKAHLARETNQRPAHSHARRPD